MTITFARPLADIESQVKRRISTESKLLRIVRSKELFCLSNAVGSIIVSMMFQPL